MKNKRINIWHNGLASWGGVYIVNNAMLDSGVEDNVGVNNEERCQGIRRQRCFKKDANFLAIWAFLDLIGMHFFCEEFYEFIEIGNDLEISHIYMMSNLVKFGLE